MTEFVVIVLFLAPILLCLPYIAKFYESKHRTTQMARYLAWEDTVYGNKKQKSTEQRKNDLISRFLTTGDYLISSNQSAQDNTDLPWDPILASFSHSDSHLAGIIDLNGISQKTTVIKNDSLLQDALSASVSPLSLTGFSIDTNGLKQYSATVPVHYPNWLNTWLGTDVENMVFEQKIVMYTDSWNTTSNSHLTDMVSSLMPSRVVPARLVTRVLSITSKIMPWTSKWSTLEFGKINVSSAPAVYYRQAIK